MKRMQEHSPGRGADDLDHHRQEQAIYKEYDNQYVESGSGETDHYSDSNFDSSTNFQGVHQLNAIEMASFRSEHYDNGPLYEDQNCAIEASPKIREVDDSFDKSKSIQVPSKRGRRRIRFMANVAVWIIQISATAGSFLSIWTVSGCKFVSKRCYNDQGHEVECLDDYYLSTTGAFANAASNTISFKSFGFFNYDAFRGGSVGVIGGACATYPSSTGIEGIVPLGIIDVNSFQAAQVCAVTASMLSVFLALASYTVGVFVVRHDEYTFYSALVALFAALLCILQGCTFLALSISDDFKSDKMTFYMDSTAYCSAAAMMCFFVVMCCAATKLATICSFPKNENEYIKHNTDEDSLKNEKASATHSPNVVKQIQHTPCEEDKDEEENISEDVSERGMLNDSSGSYLNSRTFSIPSEERWLESMPTYTMPGGTSVY